MKKIPALLLLCVSSLAAADPRIIDQVGAGETDIRVVPYPGNPTTWAPEVVFFVEHDALATEDVVLVEWREGKKALAPALKCGASRVQDNLARFLCRFEREAAITRGGTFHVGLTYKQTLAGKTSDLGTLTFKAIEIFQGAANNQRKTFTDDRDHQLGLTTIEEFSGGMDAEADVLASAVSKHRKLDKSPQELVIRFWTKYDGRGPNGMTMACLLGDKKVGEAGNVTGGGVTSYWTFKGKEQHKVEYRQQGFRFMRMLSGKPEAPQPAQFFLGENPGDYKCVAMADGEIVKEVHFTVGADGQIARTPCDDQARLYDHVHILQAKDVAVANLAYDQAAGKKTGYFGRVAWKDGCPSR